MAVALNLITIEDKNDQYMGWFSVTVDSQGGGLFIGVELLY